MTRICATTAAAAAVLCLALLPALPAGAADAPPAAGTAEAKTFAEMDQLFANYALDSHIPGLVYGVVANGRLLHVGSYGVQDLESRRPVGAESLFRIASMTKAFAALTILKLRDDGKLRLDELAETYVPELKAWKYPPPTRPAYACAIC